MNMKRIRSIGLAFLVGLIVSGCVSKPLLSVDNLHDGDMYELKEDVFLLPCNKGRLMPPFCRPLPFTTDEWSKTEDPSNLEGWSRYVKGVVPKGTRLVIDRVVIYRDNTPVWTNCYRTFESGPISNNERATVYDLVGTNSPNNITASRYLEQVK